VEAGRSRRDHPQKRCLTANKIFEQQSTPRRHHTSLCAKKRTEDFTMTRHKLALSVMAVALAIPSLATALPPDPAPIFGQEPSWDAPPKEFRDIQRQGFHDGIEGARKDYDNHRRPDVNNRDEYRHPHVPDSAKADYRDGFRRGYDSAMDHMMNANHPR
jgi:hypothetical protein